MDTIYQVYSSVIELVDDDPRNEMDTVQVWIFFYS